MGLFNRSAGNQHNLASLDETGSLAAVYPSEDQLWLYGPTIANPETYAVSTDHNGGMGADGMDEFPAQSGPTMAEAEATETWLHEVINGQTSNGAYGEEWVNLAIGGPAGYGNFNEQPFYSGHSQIVQANPAAEQGWGVGPARRWAHYPFSELQNPARNARNHLRMGSLPWAFSEQNMLYYRTQLIWEQQWDPYKQRNPVNPVVAVPPTVPFTQVVPTYGGGDVAYPGLDVPLSDNGSGVY